MVIRCLVSLKFSLPSTLTEYYGSITYELIIVMEKYGARKRTVKTEIQVVNTVDLITVDLLVSAQTQHCFCLGDTRVKINVTDVTPAF